MQNGNLGFANQLTDLLGSEIEIFFDSLRDFTEVLVKGKASNGRTRNSRKGGNANHDKLKDNVRVDSRRHHGSYIQSNVKPDP